MEKIELIEKLSGGYSTQSKTANQFWLVLIIASIIALTGKKDKEGLIELPFTLGKVNIADFYTISIILISVLIIAFTSAMIQAIRARILIQKVIDQTANKFLIDQAANKFLENVHVQDYADSILTPTYNRVAPISQFILGKKQFLGDGEQGKFRRSVGITLYVVLKFSTFIFMYFIPVSSVFKCYSNLKAFSESNTIPISNSVLLPIILLALTSVLILFIGDLKYLSRVIKRLR